MERSASTSLFNSARRKWITWLSSSGLPKTLRSRVYSMVALMIRSQVLSEPAPAHSRSS